MRERVMWMEMRSWVVASGQKVIRHVSISPSSLGCRIRIVSGSWRAGRNEPRSLSTLYVLESLVRCQDQGRLITTVTADCLLC